MARRPPLHCCNNCCYKTPRLPTKAEKYIKVLSIESDPFGRLEVFEKAVYKSRKTHHTSPLKIHHLDQQLIPAGVDITSPACYSI